MTVDEISASAALRGLRDQPVSIQVPTELRASRRTHKKTSGSVNARAKFNTVLRNPKKCLSRSVNSSASPRSEISTELRKCQAQIGTSLLRKQNKSVEKRCRNLI